MRRNVSLVYCMITQSSLTPRAAAMFSSDALPLIHTSPARLKAPRDWSCPRFRASRDAGDAEQKIRDVAAACSAAAGWTRIRDLGLCLSC